MAHDVVALPKSVTPSRIASNLAGTLTAVGKLDKEDIAEIDGLAASGKQKRYASLYSLSVTVLIDRGT